MKIMITLMQWITDRLDYIVYCLQIPRHEDIDWDAVQAFQEEDC